MIGLIQLVIRLPAVWPCVLLGLLLFGIVQNMGSASGAEGLAEQVPKDAFSDSKLMALTKAACIGDVDVVERYIKEGVNLNDRGIEGTTPLFWAIVCENKLGVETLLREGGDPNYTPPRVNDTPPYGGYSATWLASGAKNPEILKLLVKYGGDPNAVEVGGSQTALMRAMDNGRHGLGWDNYYTLLSSGADVNREFGYLTIADYACFKSRYDKVLDLLERGYRYKLSELRRCVAQSSVYGDDPQREWREKVLERLRRLGVD